MAPGQLPKFRDNLYHDAEEDPGWCRLRSSADRAAHGEILEEHTTSHALHGLYSLLPRKR